MTQHSPAALARSVTTRLIHGLLLLVVIDQLLTSQFMRRPFPGDPPGWTFSLHNYVGLGSVGIVAAFWVWAVVRRGETRLGRLIPWFSPARIMDVVADLVAQLRRLARLQAPDDEDGALASATHGLGLLAVTAMAATGGVYFFAEGTSVGHIMLSLHKLLANLVWVYLFAHAGLAVVHYLLGSDIFSRMFWRRVRRPQRVDRTDTNPHTIR